ncbi:MAG TPA: YihY/virulence factor BrkB family protein [Chitinophagaceae bacterium]|jgi:membrane protein|nr:YihY/virulence factor BrkB family protein [Chitinophagaceae bacterium]
MKEKLSVKGIWYVLKQSFKGFSDDKVPKLSASLAYYTIFSLAPLLILVIALCAIFLGQEAAQGTVYKQVEAFIGSESALQVQEMIKNASLGNKGTIGLIVGVVTLLIGATTVFADIQDSINGIWGLKMKPNVGIWATIKNRLLSFSIIGSLGFLLLVSLMVSAVLTAVSDRLQALMPGFPVILFEVLNFSLTFVVITALFMVIFKVLPDAKLGWKDVLGGAIATSILFMLGKFLISLYISKTNVGGSYGAAGSLVVLILWVYYSSIILYFGAEFTKAFIVKYRHDIKPDRYATIVKQVPVDMDGASLQEVHDPNAPTPVPPSGHPSYAFAAGDRHADQPGHRRAANDPNEDKPHPRGHYKPREESGKPLTLIEAVGVAAAYHLIKKIRGK